MYKIFFFLLILFFYNQANAVAGAADKYQVTMKKVEFCTDATCTTPTLVAIGSQNVDIASLAAGSEAGSFGSTTGLPIGTVYTHLRVTLDRTFTIKGSVNVSGDNHCSTDGSTEAKASSLHTGTLATNGTAADTSDTTLYLADADSYGSDSSITIAYGTPTYAISMAVGAPLQTQVQLIYALTSSYTVGLMAPKIKISFDTSKGLGAGIDGGNNCLMWPEEPVVTISLTE